MKIGQPSDIPLAATPLTSPAPVKSGASSGAAVKATPDANASGVAVTVSTRTKAANQIAKGETADIDVDKVNAVRSAIEQGTYVVNAEAIADKLLANAQEMLDRTRS